MRNIVVFLSSPTGEAAIINFRALDTSDESEPNRLHSLVFHSLDEPIAIVDRAGDLLDVNAAWKRSAGKTKIKEATGRADHNYLVFLEQGMLPFLPVGQHKKRATHGLKDVIQGQSNTYYLEYPCGGGPQKKWFVIRVNKIGDDDNPLFCILHQDITARKEAEQEAVYLAFHDPLTNIANRRYFDLTLDNEIRRARRSKTPISLIEIDIDDFKSYNDRFGHPAADRYLIKLGKVLSEIANRPGDLVCRLGGDEFMMILSETPLHGALQIANLFRERLETTSGDEKEPLTTSIGVLTVVPEESMDRTSLMTAVDNIMYQAKSKGKRGIEYQHL